MSTIFLTTFEHSSFAQESPLNRTNYSNTHYINLKKVLAIYLTQKSCINMLIFALFFHQWSYVTIGCI